MDVKTAYTRTFMSLLEQPIHDESIKTNYYTWWQNVRESYQARSLRLTKRGLDTLTKLDIKVYTIKFPDKIVFTHDNTTTTSGHRCKDIAKAMAQVANAGPHHSGMVDMVDLDNSLFYSNLNFITALTVSLDTTVDFTS